MNMKERITIGKLAAASNVNVETIRFYERKGILVQPKKDGSFRYYPEEYITRVKFIKRSQELGFTLKETVELLELRIKDQAKCSDVLLRTEEKISEIEQKIQDLKKMKKSLKDLANCCEDTSIPLSECPVLECFINSKENK
ncbi:MerR family DNA-binding protein [Halobacteriovorax sp.]|uniref:MerR family DNA-binding protein n=1 Tax=Halobacteriovorax sp. TaxID=2020862 RepID=UPI0035659716